MLAEISQKKKVDRITYYRVWTSTRARYILTGLDDLFELTFMLAEIISKKKVDNRKTYQRAWPAISTRDRYMLTQLEFDVRTTSSKNDK